MDGVSTVTAKQIKVRTMSTMLKSTKHFQKYGVEKLTAAQMGGLSVESVTINKSLNRRMSYGSK